MKKEYVVWGAGLQGAKFYFDHNYQVTAFVDSDEKKQGLRILDIPIFPPEKLLEMNLEKVYISAVQSCDAIKSKLLGMGIPKNKISLEIIENDNHFYDARSRDKLLVYKALCDEDERKNEYEKKFDLLKKKYKKIHIYRLYIESIGEMMARYFKIYDDNKNCDENELKVYLPDFEIADRICNKKLMDLLREKIYIPDEKEIFFWHYVYRTHSNELETLDERKYSVRRYFDAIKTKAYVHEFHIKNEEAEKKCREWGIQGDYVCMASRSNKYNESVWNDSGILRNADFYDYKETIDYLKKENLIAVRMGREVEPLPSIDNVIDYGGVHYDEYLDIYISSRAKAFVCGNSGIYALAMAFSVPLLVVNMAPLAFGAGGFRYTDMDLYIPQKYYSVKEKRYLSLKEIFEADDFAFFSPERYQLLGIELKKNTGEEIKNATEELLKRIDGLWEDSLEDIENYRKYCRIMNELKENRTVHRKSWMSMQVPWRISSSYLRNNLYLLED